MCRMTCLMIVFCCCVQTVFAQQDPVPAPIADESATPPPVLPPAQKLIVPPAVSDGVPAAPADNAPAPTPDPQTVPAPADSAAGGSLGANAPNSDAASTSNKTLLQLPQTFIPPVPGPHPYLMNPCQTGAGMMGVPPFPAGMAGPPEQYPFPPGLPGPGGPHGYLGPAPIGPLHPRYPYYSYRRPWYTPGPASLNVTIIW